MQVMSAFSCLAITVSCLCMPSVLKAAGKLNILRMVCEDILLTSLLLPVVLHAADAPKPISKPNILILLADDMGYGDPGCYHPKSKIPPPAEDLRACAEHGEKSGVIVAVQNHGDFLNNGLEHLILLKRVDHPWCGPLVDTGKYLTADPYADIALMVPHAVNWQIKEALGSSLRSPLTDFRKLAQIVHNGGYRGFLPIETLAMERKDYDPFVKVKKVLVALREAIATLK